jgi:hypothetical protein
MAASESGLPEQESGSKVKIEASKDVDVSS